MWTTTNIANAAAALCLTPEETRIFDSPCAVLCAFSAKEAVFKAIAPDSTSRFWLAGIDLTRDASNLLSWTIPEIYASGHTHLYLAGDLVVSLCMAPG
ncbi:4'-phosphopantetheinyl transferase family protein [Leisingera aquimarina]|uniref:4'-phosphopantetheinyl transferase family protein n=1 Tax=Leisingera aquimarina TaxID=476529 RepID=UPI0012EB5841